jgi:DNA-binding FadR family transcriptional regulator
VSSNFEPLPFEPGYRRVASAIAARILDRTLPYGEPLPSENELAAQFAVNRSTIREALRELESADLVARRRGTKRMVVARPKTDQVAGRVRHALTLNDVTVREVWAMLEVLEPPAAEAAARERSDAGLAAIRSAVDAYRTKNATAQDVVDGVGGFFRAVANATGNRVLPLMQEPLLLLLEAALRVVIDAAPPARNRIAEAQAQLLAAIEARDAVTARLWMTKHVRDFRRGFELCRIDLDTPVPAPPTT